MVSDRATESAKRVAKTAIASRQKTKRVPKATPYWWPMVSVRMPQDMVNQIKLEAQRLPDVKYVDRFMQMLVLHWFSMPDDKRARSAKSYL